MRCKFLFRMSLALTAVFSPLIEAKAATKGWLSTVDNRIVTSSGEVWLAHGVNVMDMRNNDSCWNYTDSDRATRLVQDVMGMSLN